MKHSILTMIGIFFTFSASLNAIKKAKPKIATIIQILQADGMKRIIDIPDSITCSPLEQGMHIQAIVYDGDNEINVEGPIVRIFVPHPKE